MKIGIDLKNQIIIMKPEGRLDAHGAMEFQEVWKKNFGTGILCAIIDMKKVDYLSSAGLRIFLMIFKALKARGGAVALSGAHEYCLNVMDMAGFAESFPSFTTNELASAYCEDIIRQAEMLKRWDSLETVKLDCGSVRIIPASSDRGIINVLGDVKNVLYSRITTAELCSKRFSETEYSIGLGGLGDRIEDYFPIMGEMITIGGTMVWLPTDGNDMPDFLIPKKDKGLVTLRTGFNVSIGGHFNELMMFESSEQGGTPIGEIYRALFNLSKTRRKDFRGALGMAMRAQMSRVLGSGINKSPVIDFKPANGEMVVHPSNFKEWFSSDTVPRYENVTGLICGVGVDLSADLSAYNQDIFEKVFYLHPSNVGAKTELLHNHGVIFAETTLAERSINLEAEIQKLVEEGEFIDMRHLIDSSSVTRALIGITYIQDFRPDPSGIHGV